MGGVQRGPPHFFLRVQTLELLPCLSPFGTELWGGHDGGHRHRVLSGPSVGGALGVPWQLPGNAASLSQGLGLAGGDGGGSGFCLAARPLGFPEPGGSHAGRLGKVTKPLSPAEKGVRPLVCSYALHGNRHWHAGHSGCLAMRGVCGPPPSLTDSPHGAPSLSQAYPQDSASLLCDLWQLSAPLWAATSSENLSSWTLGTFSSRGDM